MKIIIYTWLISAFLFNIEVFPQSNDPQNFPKGLALKVDNSLTVKNHLNGRTIYEQSFQISPMDWEKKGGWEVSKYPSNNFNSANTNVSGKYNNRSDEWLISPAISLPGTNDQILLEVHEWFEIENVYDKGFIKLSTDDGRNWITICANEGYSDWREKQHDISRFKGKVIKIAFNLVTDESVGMRGWCIGDLKILSVAKPLSLSVNITSLNSQNFPFIYMNAAVEENGIGIDNLTQSNFSVYENNTLQNDLFSVTPPQTGGGVRLADIIFLMDNSGSMSEEQQSVQNNMIAFVDSLVAAGVDFNLGLCRYGDFSNNGNPVIEDNGILTNDAEYFKNVVWARNVIDGGTEPGYYAVTQSASSFSFRPGSQKIFIEITDETPDQGGATQQEAINALVNNSITFFALTEADLYTMFTPLTQASNGNVFDIYSPFDQILEYITAQVANSYVISYRSSDPNFNGITRDVELRVNYNGDQSSDFSSYIPGAAPTIVRTANTMNYHTQSWADGTSFNIEVDITDNIAPGVQSATLYYKNTSLSGYSSVNMIKIPEVAFILVQFPEVM